MAERMRLDKLLGRLGIGTRSQARDWIRSGRATVDGETVRDPARAIDPVQAAVAVDGHELVYRLHRHLMLHKPAGVLTAASDTRETTVMDLLPPLYRACGCMPVGRLDRATEGLLLFTSDGTLAHRLLAPHTGVEKVYLAMVDGPLDEADVTAFAAGIALRDFTAQSASLTILESGSASARALCGVCEGKNHQVRRMFGARGRRVLLLKRLFVGPLALDNALPPGAYRELTPAEEAALYAAAGLSPAEEE
jgi:16S rRNA pseudouridine516 synthase